MEATFKFDLPQEQEEYEIYNNARKLNSVLIDFSTWLSRKYKYIDYPSEDAQKEYEEIRDKLIEELNSIELHY